MSKFFVFFANIFVLLAVNGEYYGANSREEYEQYFGADGYESMIEEAPAYQSYAQESYPIEESVEYEYWYNKNMYEPENKVGCQNSEHLTSVEGHCQKFKMCANGKLYIMDCPAELVFDSKLKICNNKDNVSGECGLMQSSYYYYSKK
ncbi:hypothetical protein BpHYR1_011704 [Brachionus plicatilis]|uniref:Chitin-binding type-2 domain-containing protein n=1 Tax=Brachionus plicatilis TaxID=10195 RepID=A0A3M7PNV5_BRAPC|nr:hypothetical protein BpHYR1_011704 [Brachionus plicatilis]